jgi:hypothetical protein
MFESMRCGSDGGLERVDLSEESGFFLDLLDDTLAWRERLVGELRFGNRNHVRFISAFQVDFPPAMLEARVSLERAGSANVLLPLTARPKRPLLNFALSGPGGSPATLTSRASSAGLQVQYLSGLLETSAASSQLKSTIKPDLLEAICVFTPGFFNYTFLKDGDGDFAHALSLYLSSGLHLEVGKDDVCRWREKTARAGEILARRLGEPPDPVSSSEEMLLALPQMSEPPRSIGEIDSTVDDFCVGVHAADRAEDRSFLGVLAEYGRRYEMVVEVEVPLLEPCRIKVEEDLPLELKRGRRFAHWVDQSFALGDARSAHLEARVDDPNVEIAGFKVHDLQQRDATGWLETVRRTREALAIYTSEVGRPYYVAVSVRLSVARPLMIGASLLCLANLLAIVAVPAIGFHGAVGERFAVLAIPTTIAATFVLVREQTALATRLQWVPRAILAATTFALWAEIVIGLSAVGVDSPASAKTSSHPARSTGLSRQAESPGTMKKSKGERDGKERSEGQRSYRVRSEP